MEDHQIMTAVAFVAAAFAYGRYRRAQLFRASASSNKGHYHNQWSYGSSNQGARGSQSNNNHGSHQSKNQGSGSQSEYPGSFQDQMTRKEAALILGVGESSGVDKIKEAHRRMIVKNHPDHGGSAYIAAKINQAKDKLLK